MPSKKEQPGRVRVTGIGGVFFRAQNPEKLEAWYSENLGIPDPAKTYDDPPWRQQEGSTVFQPFKSDTQYFGDASKSWMLNFRVEDLDAMVAWLLANGIRVEVDPEIYPNGRFARLLDPEGNPIQLWEPGGTDPH
ncbi:MAG: VOC family protein [Hyphomonas sp.]